VTLRLRAAQGDLSGVELDIWIPAADGSVLGEKVYDATRVAQVRAGDGYD
jgi:hypothetical protein